MSWNDYISHYLLSEGKCYAGALGNSSDYKLFAAQGTSSEEEGWAATFSEDFETEVLVDEVTEQTQKVTINEATALREAMETGSTSNGLFIGGNKYRIVKYETDFDCAGQEVVCLFGALGKKGVCVINTGTMLVMGMYDEELGQTGGNCKSACAAFAEICEVDGVIHYYDAVVSLMHFD
ncbi:hypothetical protein FOL47_009318 [Perkinsus chesapeaki]|uniref:Profilin n=1 Tax=Perkinsus chesapeaki TaxID=330153 RepID=A0A7J6L931_PERCH|nr:hypothetical protein FOL47_009318 [Perkinsus chesapeaki]